MSDQIKIKELQAQSYGYVVFEGLGTRAQEYKNCQWLTKSGVFIDTATDRLFLIGEIYRTPLVLPGDPDWVLVPKDSEEELDFDCWCFDLPTNLWVKMLESYSGVYYAQTIKRFLEIWPETAAIRRRKVCAVCGGSKQVLVTNENPYAATIKRPQPCPSCQPEQHKKFESRIQACRDSEKITGDDMQTIVGAAKPSDGGNIIGLIEKWHMGAGNGKTLAEFLGLTNDEYALWVKQPQSLPAGAASLSQMQEDSEVERLGKLAAKVHAVYERELQRMHGSLLTASPETKPKEPNDQSQSPAYSVGGLDTPWPAFDIVCKLIEAAAILLESKSYDGQGHEELSEALRLARKWRKERSGYVIPLPVSAGIRLAAAELLSCCERVYHLDGAGGTQFRSAIDRLQLSLDQKPTQVELDNLAIERLAAEQINTPDPEAWEYFRKGANAAIKYARIQPGPETASAAVDVINIPTQREVDERVFRALSNRVTEYLEAGGMFNPEMMDHDEVRDLLIDCRKTFDLALAYRDAKGTK